MALVVGAMVVVVVTTPEVVVSGGAEVVVVFGIGSGGATTQVTLVDRKRGPAGSGTVAAMVSVPGASLV